MTRDRWPGGDAESSVGYHVRRGRGGPQIVLVAVHGRERQGDEESGADDVAVWG